MTKAELIAAVARDAGITKAQATRVIDSYIANVTKELKKRDKFRIVGFGTFSVVKRKARTGLNPQTGAKIEITAKNIVKFKEGSQLKDSIRDYPGGPIPPPRKK